MPTSAQSNVQKKPRRLGRGLSSLIGEPVSITKDTRPPVSGATNAEPQSTAGERVLQLIPLHQIVPNRFQPRQHFDEAALDRLAQSIRSAGVMQPIVVRAIDAEAAGHDAPDGAQWELIAGERRWRAAQRVGLETVPAVVADLSDQDSAEWSLIENLQREDLNPIERAHAFRQLVTSFGLTQGQVAGRVGLDRSTIANLIRLTELEELIQEEIRARRLTPGHGKALLMIGPGKERTQLAIRARDGAWSVRRLEQHIQQSLLSANQTSPDRLDEHDHSLRSASKRDLERRLRDRLGTKVKVHLDAAGLRGRMVVEFYDPEQLEGVLRKMGVSPESVG